MTTIKAKSIVDEYCGREAGCSVLVPRMESGLDRGHVLLYCPMTCIHLLNKIPSDAFGGKHLIWRVKGKPTTKICSRCFAQGNHTAKQCPGAKKCSRCGSLSHISSDQTCKDLYMADKSNFPCLICKKIGHHALSCRTYTHSTDPLIQLPRVIGDSYTVITRLSPVHDPRSVRSSNTQSIPRSSDGYNNEQVSSNYQSGNKRWTEEKESAGHYTVPPYSSLSESSSHTNLSPQSSYAIAACSKSRSISIVYNRPPESSIALSSAQFKPLLDDFDNRLRI